MSGWIMSFDFSPAWSAADPAALLTRFAPTATGSASKLRGVLADVATRPGGLFRLRLILALGRALELDLEKAERLAAAVEFYHTASLLLDDLPCMDDAAVRRGEPCAHVRHGEAATILGSLALINRGYALVGEATADLPFHLRTEASRVLELCLGPAGLVGGQALDLEFAANPRDVRAVGRAAIGKTVALLRLTLELPAIAGAATPQERRQLRRLAVYWGLLYQGLDDLRDLQLAALSGAAKTDGRDATLGRPNLALAAGLPETLVRLRRLDALARAGITELVHCGRCWAVLWLFHRQLAGALDAQP